MSVSAVALSSRTDPFLPFSLLAIGGSAGAIGALQQLLAQVPAGFPIPIVVVQHLAARFDSRLPTVLGFRTGLPCRWAREGEMPRPGTIHVARPGTNLLLAADGRFLEEEGPKPRLGWPSVDTFFSSMASHVGARGIGVILSGMLYDGAKGISALRRAGGATMVQHPRTAQFPDMPTAAVDLGRADLMLPLEQIWEAISILAEYGVK